MPAWCLFAKELITPGLQTRYLARQCGHVVTGAGQVVGLAPTHSEVDIWGFLGRKWFWARWRVNLIDRSLPFWYTQSSLVTCYKWVILP